MSDFYQITGFQSPCSEYREKGLSLDERYQLTNPSVFLVEVSGDSRSLGLKAQDKLIIDRALKPKEGDLVLMVLSGEFKLERYSIQRLKMQDPEGGDFLWGVVTTLLRDYR